MTFFDIPPSDIWLKIKQLEEKRQKFQKNIMEEYDKVYYEKIKILQNECFNQIGHNFKFNNFGQLGNPHYKCTYCGFIKIEKEL